MFGGHTDIVSTGILPGINIQSIWMWYLDYHKTHKMRQSGLPMEISHCGLEELTTIKSKTCLTHITWHQVSISTSTYALKVHIPWGMSHMSQSACNFPISGKRFFCKTCSTRIFSSPRFFFSTKPHWFSNSGSKWHSPSIYTKNLLTLVSMT